MKIRVAIMGCAQIAKRSLAPSFIRHPAFELVAVASRTRDKAAGFIASLPADCPVSGVRVSSYDDILTAEDINLVYCPLPTGLHYEWVKKALESRKHVLCEKSLSTNLAEVEDLVMTARSHHCFLMESFQFRFHAQNLYVKDLLAKNAIGEVRQLIVRFGIPPFPEGASNIRYSSKLGGGALLDNGAYTIKCATYLLGGDVKVLAAMEGGATPLLGNVPLTGSIMMSVTPQPSAFNVSPQKVCVQTAYGFDHFYQNSYEMWGTDGKISTMRSFTAREDFSAPVVLETKNGKETRMFSDDHFARMLDYVAKMISSGDFEREYGECLLQAKLLAEVSKKGREA